MIGLVNSIGASQAVRAQSVYAAASLADESESKKPVPIVNGRQVAERVLRAAVATIQLIDEDHGQDKTRSVPGDEQSDRFDRADQEARSPTTVGAHLDLTV